MEKPPKFIEEFSRKESPEERQQVAEDIRAKRAEHFSEKCARTEKQAELQQSISEREQALFEQLESIRDLEDEIGELSTARFGEVLHYFRLRKLRADAAIGQRTYEELKEQQDAGVVEQQVISAELGSEETPPALRKAKEMLDDFYRNQKEKWAKSDYTNEDITENFSEEHLASLSLEDYSLLLRRFPGEMVAHVTRQGIRDHIGHAFHTGGEGAYANGFMKMVEDGRLRSPLGVYLVESDKEEAVARFLHLSEFSTKDEALKYLSTLTDVRQGEQASYVDRMAIHFATEEVADCYYGSEKGNEIFVAYPSTYIASQYYFSGQLTEGGGGYWNDQWVWANEERGMDLNAGLVFIPAEARVDRETGSRYEIDQDGNPIKNFEYQTAFRRVVDSADFHDFARQAMEITGKLNQSWDNPDLSSRNQDLLRKLEPFRQKLEDDFGITDRRLQMAILNYHNLFGIDVQKRNEEEGKENPFGSVDSEIERALKEEGILYVEAKNAISSKEFWETYFDKNSSQRSSKIVYYKGADPTRALWRWRQERGISKRVEDINIGFAGRRVERDAPEATAGLERFKILAEKVIEDYFARS
ncbi:MAG: hypothetical protein V2A55_00375 [Candidatus Jorgensenbacteria bacterium]